MALGPRTLRGVPPDIVEATAASGGVSVLPVEHRSEFVEAAGRWPCCGVCVPAAGKWPRAGASLRPSSVTAGVSKALWPWGQLHGLCREASLLAWHFFGAGDERHSLFLGK